MPHRLAALNLSLVVDPGTEAAAARQCFEQMRPEEWAQLVRLAAEVVCIQESQATGQVFLVAPVSSEHLAAVVHRSRSTR